MNINEGNDIIKEFFSFIKKIVYKKNNQDNYLAKMISKIIENSSDTQETINKITNKFINILENFNNEMESKTEDDKESNKNKIIDNFEEINFNKSTNSNNNNNEDNINYNHINRKRKRIYSDNSLSEKMDSTEFVNELRKKLKKKYRYRHSGPGIVFIIPDADGNEFTYNWKPIYKKSFTSEDNAYCSFKGCHGMVKISRKDFKNRLIKEHDACLVNHNIIHTSNHHNRAIKKINLRKTKRKVK